MDKLEIADELIAERRAGEVGDTPQYMNPLIRLIVANIHIMPS